ncbi:hypothetical protein Q9Q99_12420 [Curtobacterium flaccumfaciens]|nr:hypothetical protein Q9Q99_12420 [Curtobacterium flaccumfaciens]
MSRGRRSGTAWTPFALRPALRLGRRLAFAKAGRAALIIALIGIPTAGFAAVAVVVQSTQATATERLDHDLGQASAQMRVSGPDLPGMVQDPVQWEFTDSKRNSPVTKSDQDSPVRQRPGTRARRCAVDPGRQHARRAPGAEGSGRADRRRGQRLGPVARRSLARARGFPADHTQ